VELVVEALVRQAREDRLHPLVGAVARALLATGLRGQIVVQRLLVERVVPQVDGDDALLDGEVEVQEPCLGAEVRDEPPERDVVGIDERGDDQPRLVGRVLVQRVDELDHLARVGLVAAAWLKGPAVGADRDPAGRAGVVGRGAVRLRADPALEAVRVEPVGTEVDALPRRVPAALGVVAHVRGLRAWFEEIGVRDVPLALPERAVAAGAEIVPERRHAVRIEPEHVRLDRALGGAVGLGHAVQRRILARPDGGAARRARDGRDVVPAELDARRAQGVLSA
jgi:hypothetical protein